MFGFIPSPPPMEIRDDHAVILAVDKGSVSEIKISLEDVERIREFGRRWTIANGKSNHKVAQASFDGRRVILHRWLLENPEGIIDHINQDPLDNRRDNLRVTSHSVNAANTNKAKNGKLRGVHFHAYGSKNPKWVARVRTNGVLKTFRSISKQEVIEFRERILREAGVFQ